jgi:hypothetical protein
MAFVAAAISSPVFFPAQIPTGDKIAAAPRNDL